ncbi:hypothetical protein N7490_006415 [Penicillium lividum]|nr:hypothetical protein N7490_006415 [Penicillium lividum]
MFLEQLPVELLTATCYYLEPLEWGSLRLACKLLYKKSLQAFARRYCKSIAVLITFDSLHQLEKLAANDGLRNEVKELWVVPNLFERHHYDFTDDGPWDCRSEFQQILSDQRTILESGDLERRLHSYMRRFQNLESVGLRPCSKEFLLNREKNTGFLCLGLRQIRNLLPYVRLSTTSSRHKTAEMIVRDIRRGHLFSALLNAVATSSPNLRRLYTCNDFECGLTPEDIYLATSDYEALMPSLRALEHLHMCLHNVRDYPDTVRFRRLLDILLTAAPCLRVLKFSQKTRAVRLTEDSHRGLRDQILDPRYFLEISQCIRLTQLEELHLDGIDITLDAIKSFLRSAAPTLKSLHMSSLSLNDLLPSLEGPEKYTKLNDQIGDEAKQLWRQVWNFLRDELALDFLSMECLSYRNKPLYLCDSTVSSREREPVCFDVKQSGISFGEWINQLDLVVSVPEGFTLPATVPPEHHQRGPRSRRQLQRALDDYSRLYTFPPFYT